MLGLGVLVVLVVALIAQAVWDSTVAGWVALGTFGLVVVARVAGGWVGDLSPFDDGD